MSSGLPFPQYLLNEIHQYPGNDRCCDCHSIDTGWASVSHGTLICLECAGKHRSLGVNVSFVRSISMDTWSKRQLEMMRQGGNGQIKRFFRRLEIATAAISELYNSQAAEHYRKKLEERVDKICSGEVKSHVRIFHKVRSTSNDSNKSVEELSRVTASNIYSVKFGLGPLGITLTKDYNGEAVISRVVAGSPAETAGIQPGDYVKGVANIFSDKYDDIMNMICTSPRPFTILLLRCSSHPLPYTSSALNVNASSAAGTITRERSSPRMQADQRKSLPGDAPSFLKDTVRSISTESAGKDDLNEEDTLASPIEHLQGLELSIDNTDIRPLSSFRVENSNLHTLASHSSEMQRSSAQTEEDPFHGTCEQDDDLDNWVEEEALSSETRTHSTYSIDDLVIDDTRASPPKPPLAPRAGPPAKPGFTLTVTFDQLPLGFTLSTTAEAKPEVIRLREGGRAMQLGVNVNDVLIAIDSESIAHYHHAMERLTHVQLPVRLTFYRMNFLRYHSDGGGLAKSLTTSSKLEHTEEHGFFLKKNLSFSNVEGVSSTTS